MEQFLSIRSKLKHFNFIFFLVLKICGLVSIIDFDERVSNLNNSKKIKNKENKFKRRSRPVRLSYRSKHTNCITEIELQVYCVDLFNKTDLACVFEINSLLFLNESFLRATYS